MNLREVQTLLDAKVLSGEGDLEREVKTAFACDLMSDVLTFEEDKTLLLTGLVNPQVIRTAEMMDINAIIFVRGKIPDEETIRLAVENQMVIMVTKKIMFVSCGILYANGLKGANIVHR